MKRKSPKVVPNCKTKMSNRSKSTHSSDSSAYPEKTKGTEIAAGARKKANSWSEEKRVGLFERGMQIIYGGSGNHSKVRSRH
jgi:hypothetical protein